MKKVIAIVLCFCFCLGMCACNSQVDNTNDKTNEQFDSLNDESSSTIVESSDNWIVQYYVDEFNQQTNEWYIANEELFYGQFSNSATTDSQLSVRVLIDGTKQWVNNSETTVISFLLYEYGLNQVKNPFSEHERYVVQIRDDNGNEYSGYGTVPSKEDRLILNAKTSDKLLEFMENSEKVAVYIKEEEGISSYLFSITTENFFDCYE